ncbi:hypothetical protein TNCV_3923071 [Trichonephila clavipes]|nr:hypothetical protein TNCV_3923071 [Trichonephila clavipes]
MWHEVIFKYSLNRESSGEEEGEETLDAEIVEVEIEVVAIYRPFGELRRAAIVHLYGAQGQRQAYPSSPCHDEFSWASIGL